MLGVEAAGAEVVVVVVVEVVVAGGLPKLKLNAAGVAVAPAVEVDEKAAAGVVDEDVEEKGG